jgi:hypothetical protein
MTQARLKKALRTAVVVLLWGALFLLTDALCLFQALTGLPCPGCGSTRAAIALLQGRFALAFSMHPLIPLSLAILPYALFRDKLLRGKPESTAEKYIILSVMALYIAVYIIRMILLFPHTLPMVPQQNALWPSILRWLSGYLSTTA